MNDLPLPVHWQFAAQQASSQLHEFVCSFDFLRYANGQTYYGITPEYLLEVIDGFLADPNATEYFRGEQASLQHLRQRLVDSVQPAYERGLVEGRKHWSDGEQVYGSLSTTELQRLALSLAGNDEWLNGWFAEGFCRAYAHAEMESAAKESSN